MSPLSCAVFVSSPGTKLIVGISNFPPRSPNPILCPLYRQHKAIRFLFIIVFLTLDSTLWSQVSPQCIFLPYRDFLQFIGWKGDPRELRASDLEVWSGSSGGAWPGCHLPSPRLSPFQDKAASPGPGISTNLPFEPLLISCTHFRRGTHSR